MARGIILVRHAMSAVERGVASRLWGITEGAREDCVLLSEHLPAAIAGPIWTSDERKAIETATVIGLRLGLPVEVDAAFAEVDRPTTWDEDYRSLAARYLDGKDNPGWEPRATVQRRFSDGIERAMADGGEGDILIVNHGLALSLYLALASPAVADADRMCGFEIAEFWKSLTFPDAWRFDPDANKVTRLFNAGLPPPDA